MWFPPEDGAEFYDFELEPRGANEWGCNEQTDELRRLILYLVQEKKAMLVKLRGLSALREVLQSVYAKQERDQANLRGAENSQELAVSAGAGNHFPTRQTQRGEKLEKDEGPVSFKDDKKQDVYTYTDSLKNTDLITNLRQANKELQGQIRLLEEVTRGSEANDNCCERCSRYVKSRLVQYIFKTKKLERALKTKDVLCSSLADKLDVMREEKTSRETGYPTRNMNHNNRGSGNEYSQPGEQCNGYSSANEPESTREQARNFQNEGSKEKTEKSVVNGSVGICSNEAQALKTRFENMEKELHLVKDELSKVCTEKSQLERRLKDLQESHDKEENALRVQINKLQQEKRQLQDTVTQYQSNEQKQKQEFDQVLYRAQEMQEMLERETQEKFASIAEQKSLRQQVENLSKNMKSLQVKSEEFVRFHCDQEDQIDDYKRLKKLIHDNGLPSIEQLIALQRQNESYREEFLNERKEKERVLSLKDKLKRDLENAQSRISSLQEQVYKYREHIFFLQQKFKQEGVSQPSSPMFDMPAPTPQGNNLSRLYGSTATQYINEMLLQGNASPKFPASPLPEGKKPGPGKHGDGTGKQWQYQQGGYGRFGRQMSAEDWKQRGPSQGQGQAWDNFYGSNQSPGRLSSTSSLSSVRSGSSSSEEVPVEGQMDGRTPFGMGGIGSRRQGPRPSGLPEKAVDESRGMQQSYGPPSSPFEPWSPKPQGFAMRGQRRYSSPTGSGSGGVRSPTSDYWPAQQPMGGFQRSWQSPAEQAQYPDSTQASMSSGLRPTAEPWPPAVTSMPSSSHAQSTLATSGQGDTMTFMSGGIGMR
ncbi:hypothetical protein ACROYT_G032533 [Oculina patagonica]